MTPSNPYSYFQCCNPACALRFPSPGSDSVAVFCPRCKTSAVLIPMADNVKQDNFPEKSDKQPQIEVLVDNIRSTYNLGAMFRTADGAGINHLYLCGITPDPENPKVSKTALGAEYAVPWTYSPNGFQTAAELLERGKRLWALEINTGAIPIFDALKDLDSRPLVLVVGNEVAGIDPGIQTLCERSIFIPMQGYKRSLNVAIAFGIAVYSLRFAHLAGNKSIDPQNRSR